MAYINPYLDTQLTLKHVILYAKGWYVKSEDFWADLRKCMTADEYAAEFFTDRECAELMLRQIERLPRKHFNTATEIIFESMENRCWRYGYYTQNNTKWLPYTKSDKAFDLNESLVRYCLMCFRDFIGREDWIPGRPDSEKCLPLAVHITEEDLLSHFGEKITTTTTK